MSSPEKNECTSVGDDPAVACAALLAEFVPQWDRSRHKSLAEAVSAAIDHHDEHHRREETLRKIVRLVSIWRRVDEPEGAPSASRTLGAVVDVLVAAGHMLRGAS